MNSTYYFIPGGLLLVDGESGKPLFSVDRGQPLDLDGFAEKHKQDLLRGLQRMMPALQVRVEAFDEVGGSPVGEYPLRIVDEGGNAVDVRTGMNGAADVYLPAGSYALRSAESPTLPATEMLVDEYAEGTTFTFIIPDDRGPEDEGEPEE
ncbi:MAG: hypothetical protein II776_06880 [Clostridia bacterium]|nr:hypothetical protein [Clostridia bacterium]